jgi:hypothetical protein
MKYLQTIGMHRMFLNVATFSVTKRSISSTKKKIDFLNIFTCYINDYLTTYYYVGPRILGHPVIVGTFLVITLITFRKSISSKKMFFLFDTVRI